MPPTPASDTCFRRRCPDRSAPTRSPGATAMPQSLSHRMLAQQPIKTKSGTVRITDSSVFPASKNIAAALVEVEPGGMRELHWHPNTDEWQYYIEGQARMGVFAAAGQARTFDFMAGDVGYVPFADGALHRKHRQDATAFPRDVQEQLLRRRFAGPVDGADAARTRRGTPQAGPASDGGIAQGQSASRAGLIVDGSPHIGFVGQRRHLCHARLMSAFPSLAIRKRAAVLRQ